MIYQWVIDRPLPAGSQITVGNGRLSVVAPGDQALHQAVLPPTEEEVRLRAEVNALHAEIAEPAECECGYQDTGVSS